MVLSARPQIQKAAKETATTTAQNGPGAAGSRNQSRIPSIEPMKPDPVHFLPATDGRAI